MRFTSKALHPTAHPPPSPRLALRKGSTRSPRHTCARRCNSPGRTCLLGNCQLQGTVVQPCRGWHTSAVYVVSPPHIRLMPLKRPCVHVAMERHRLAPISVSVTLLEREHCGWLTVAIRAAVGLGTRGLLIASRAELSHEERQLLERGRHIGVRGVGRRPGPFGPGVPEVLLSG